MHDPRLVISLKEPRPPVVPAPTPPPTPDAPKEIRAQFRRFRRLALYVVAVAAVLLVAFLVYGWWRLRTPATAPSDVPASAAAATPAARDANDLVARVARHIELPAGETPTIAAVTDLSKFAGQPFFAHAKVGDQVLLYTQAKKAILYDPVADKVIEVAPISK